MLIKRICKICRNKAYPGEDEYRNDVCNGAWKGGWVYCPEALIEAYAEEISRKVRECLSDEQNSFLNWSSPHDKDLIMASVSGFRTAFKGDPPPAWCPYKSEHGQG